MWTVGEQIQLDKYPDLRDFMAARGEQVMDSPLAPYIELRPRAAAVHFPLQVREHLWGLAVVSYDLSRRILTTGQLETFATFADLVQHQIERFVAEEHRLEQWRSVVHNARKPINAVMGLVDLLRDMPAGKERNDLVDTARSALESASGKLQTLTGIWHVQKGSVVHARRQECDLREVAQRTLGLFTLQARDEGVRLSLDCPHERATALSDPVTVQHVLLELIDNSLRWFPRATEDKRVLVEIVPSAKPGGWDVFVSDNGSGFDENTRKRAFDIKPSTERGAGLGLPGAAVMVNSLGGQIEVLAKPRLDTGATVVVRLPPGE